MGLRKKLRKALARHFGKARPHGTGAITPNSGWTPTDGLLGRLQSCYAHWLKDYRPETGHVWPRIQAMRNDVHEALLGQDRELLRTLLANPRRTNLYYGVDNLCAEAPILDPHALAVLALQQINHLGVAFGVMNFHNPETGRPETPLADAEIVLTKLPFPIDFPNPFEGEAGLPTRRGLIAYRAVHAVYQAIRVIELAGTDARCLEIGAGMGRTAYYATRFGLRTYTIVDLPLALAGQACFLAATLGDEAIWFDGEEGDGRDKVRLCPPDWIERSDEHFDIILNVDSLTEMDIVYARQYINFMRQRASALLSINHEVNPFTARSLFTPEERSYRCPYILRPGYAEEVFRFRHETAP